ILIHVDVPPQQPAVAVPGRRDRRVIVRLRRGDDPRVAARGEPSDPPEHRTRRGEISEHHLEPMPALDIPTDAPPPAVAHAHTAGELPLQRTAPLAVLADHAPDRPKPRALAG